MEKCELRLWRGLHLWKNRFTFVGVLRWWAGLRLTALQAHIANLKSNLKSDFFIRHITRYKDKLLDSLYVRRRGGRIFILAIWAMHECTRYVPRNACVRNCRLEPDALHRLPSFNSLYLYIADLVLGH